MIVSSLFRLRQEDFQLPDLSPELFGHQTGSKQVTRLRFLSRFMFKFKFKFKFKFINYLYRINFLKPISYFRLGLGRLACFTRLSFLSRFMFKFKFKFRFKLINYLYRINFLKPISCFKLGLGRLTCFTRFSFLSWLTILSHD